MKWTDADIEPIAHQIWEHRQRLGEARADWETAIAVYSLVYHGRRRMDYSPREGDVLFVAHSPETPSVCRAIGATLNGFCHSAIVFRDRLLDPKNPEIVLVAESTTLLHRKCHHAGVPVHGVQSAKFLDWLADQPGAVVIVRPRQIDADALLLFVRNCIRQKVGYDARHAFTSALRLTRKLLRSAGITKDTPERMFCSEFVARALLFASEEIKASGMFNDPEPSPQTLFSKLVSHGVAQIVGHYSPAVVEEDGDE